MTVVTCDLCGHVSYGDASATRKWALVDRGIRQNVEMPFPEYLDLCTSCYEGLVHYISLRRPKRINKDQMTFEKDFPEFVTEEKSGDYFEKLVKADPEPWKE